MSAEIALRDADGQCQHHGTTEGCYRCCPRCNYDTHTCPGCGSPVPHGTAACAACDPKPAPVAMTSPMAEPPARTVELDATAASWYQALRFADAEIERLTGVRGRAIERIQDAMGDAQQATVDGQPVVSWKPSKPGRTLDRKALEAAYGADVIAGFDREKKAARPFRVLDVQDGA